MSQRIERVIIVILEAFIAVSAISGGIGLAGGGIDFPLGWLAGTPFASYLIPGVILGAVVGGSALAAMALMLLAHPLALPAAFAAGLIQAGWIIGEILLVGTHGVLMLSLQILYFAAGTLLAALAADLWLRTHCREISGRPAATGRSL